MRRILVIEDDTHIANTLKEILSRQGYDVKLTYSGEEGINCFIEETPDLILLDVTLPDADGLTVLGNIKRASAVPVIMLTEKGSGVTAGTILYSKANDCLTKPFYASELLARVEVQLSPSRY